MKLLAVAEIDSSSTLNDTCLATEVQKFQETDHVYTVQRLLKLVSQRLAHERHLNVLTCNSGLIS